MEKCYKYIVFDLDGTLMDTFPGVIYSFTRLVEELGLREMTLEEKRSVIGPPLEDSFERLFGLVGEENQHALDLFNRYYATREGAGNSIPYPGVRETLQKLRDRGCRLGVATMKPWVFTSIALEVNDMTKYFDAVFCYEDNSHITKAQLVRKTLEKMGCADPAGTAVLIGDSPIDGHGAEEVGIDFCAVTGGFGFDDPALLEELPHVAVAELIPGLWDYLDAHI